MEKEEIFGEEMKGKIITDEETKDKVMGVFARLFAKTENLRFEYKLLRQNELELSPVNCSLDAIRRYKTFCNEEYAKLEAKYERYTEKFGSVGFKPRGRNRRCLA